LHTSTTHNQDTGCCCCCCYCCCCHRHPYHHQQHWHCHYEALKELVKSFALQQLLWFRQIICFDYRQNGALSGRVECIYKDTPTLCVLVE